MIATVVGLGRALRAAGLVVGSDQCAALAQALALPGVDPLSKRDLHLAARATLVSRHEDLELFEQVFAAFLGEAAPGRPRKVPPAPRHDRGEPRLPALVTYMAERARAAAREVAMPEDARAASSMERLASRDFGDCTSEELATLERVFARMRFAPALRRSLRFVRGRRGERLDLPLILRRAARLAGTAVALPRRTRKLKRRPLVVLADISGSMEVYARILLQFLHGLGRWHAETETFAFGTRLTRITAALKLHSIDHALDEAARAIPDFAGGTRIGASIQTFNRVHARRVVRPGTVVLIISDGWETGDPATLAAELGRLRARCHRLVWLNPLLGRTGYQPRARGMAAALAHVDDFLPANNLQSLGDLAHYLARVQRRRGTLAPREPRGTA
jgi:hypothetical protein